MTSEAGTRWQPVEPLPPVNGAVAPILATVDSLRRAWEEALESSTVEERAAARERRLRRHAVETGIIERLYEVDWGTTEMLVAEGLSTEVANRAGGIPEETLQLIRDQYDALEFLTSLAQEGTELSVYLIRQLHQIITRHQYTYEARDQFGRVFQRPLRHGEWKQQPNHVRRPDGSVLEYAPPEHVQSEMEQLVAFYRQSAGTHPVVRAAWLHYRFIQIHPFEDGNGRVARALTLLVLLRDYYAPLVVDRRERTSYIAALDAANDGDPSELVRFFGQLEIAALQSSVPRPIADEIPAAGKPEPVLELAPTDSVTLAYTDRFADRHEEVEELLRSTLRSAVERFVGRLG